MHKHLDVNYETFITPAVAIVLAFDTAGYGGIFTIA